MQLENPLHLAQAHKRRVVVEALPPGGLAYLCAVAARWPRTLCLCPDEERAERLHQDLLSLGLQHVVFLPGQQYVPFADVAADTAVGFARLATRQRLLQGRLPAVVVASVAAVQTLWPHADDVLGATQTYQVGEDLKRDLMAAHLVTCGFMPVNFVEDEGTFALRGGVIDIFVPGTPLPYRLDLFGDELVSIKTFAPESQRTFGASASLEIFPIREVIFTDATVHRAQTLLRDLGERADLPSRRLRLLREEIGQRHYFYGVEALWPAFYTKRQSPLELLMGPQTCVVLDDAAAIGIAAETRLIEAEAARTQASERHMPVVQVDDHLLGPAAFWRHLDGAARVDHVALALSAADKAAQVSHGLRDCAALVGEVAARRRNPALGEILDPIDLALRTRQRHGHATFLCCNTLGNAQRLRELFLGRSLDLPLWTAFEQAIWSAPGGGQIAIVVAPLAASFTDVQHNIMLLCDVDVLGATPRRAGPGRRKKTTAAGLSTLRDLREGDPIIHQDHGIGRYLGLKRLILGGVDGDFVLLEYADGDKLYLPAYRLSLLQRYAGPRESIRLDKLGGSRWERAKQRVKDTVLVIAHELLALQAQRALRPGFALPPADAAYQAFVASFPYQETPDQQRAIDDVLKDLRRDTPMDRLICGDVGFGKTEVAMRATFLAIAAGRQVAVLVPTTVLAEQHRNTFAQRLEGFGAVVEVLSRFRSPAQTREMLARLRVGAVDVVIGTHRMLSTDVHIKNLGLLIVDEEQRFGVKHKERIKQLRHQVHVLTLSATPIPRTLHMASIGLRDLSLITTPPAARSAIRTEVLRFDEAVIADAIKRELHRGGQVFVVHNRVQSIASMADLVQRLVPEAKVAMAHGQMGGEALEKIMVAFVRREMQVLVCTAIIESGIDIPTANTMIVNRADTFGLSQLYQLRGRIGRGSARAYAYLMLPRSDKLGREATQRLGVLKRFSELGAGFQIASHDLELRGAGDLLGADQSGNIAAVGFELYTELLAEAVEQARGQKLTTVVEPDIKVPVSAVLPEHYIPDPMQRLGYYQRMAQATSDEDIYNIFSELQDMYGRAPGEACSLVEVMVLRRRLKGLGSNALSAAADGKNLKVGLSFVVDAPIDRANLAHLCQTQPGRYRLLPSGRLALVLEGLGTLEGDALLQAIRQALTVFKTLGA